MAVERTFVGTFHILAVLLVYLLGEADADTLERDACHVDVIGKVNNHVAVDFTIVDGVGEGFQLLAVAYYAGTADRADVVVIFVVGALGLALGVGVGDVATWRAVAVEGAVGIDHGV